MEFSAGNEKKYSRSFQESKLTTETAPKDVSEKSKATKPVSPLKKDKDINDKADVSVDSWTIEDVTSWLEQLGFETDMFRKNFVDGRLLGELDDEMLKDDLKMTSKLQRKRLLLAISDLKTKR